MRILAVLSLAWLWAAGPAAAGPVAAAPALWEQAAKTTATEGKALVDINSASLEELKAIPGIGDAYAKKIIENRPYRAKDDLVKRKLLPGHVYEKVKDRIVARQATKR